MGWLINEPLVSIDEVIESDDFLRRIDGISFLSTPISKMRIYPSIAYKKIIEAEEKKFGLKLLSEEITDDDHFFEIIDYKYPEVKKLMDYSTEYYNGAKDVYESLKWF